VLRDRRAQRFVRTRRARKARKPPGEGRRGEAASKRKVYSGVAVMPHRSAAAGHGSAAAWQVRYLVSPSVVAGSGAPRRRPAGRW